MYVVLIVQEQIDLIFICTLLTKFCKYFRLFFIVLCKQEYVVNIAL